MFPFVQTPFDVAKQSVLGGELSSFAGNEKGFLYVFMYSSCLYYISNFIFEQEQP